MSLHSRTMCADRNFYFPLDATRGTDGDLSSFYRISANQQPLGKYRAVRDAQGDRGRELVTNLTHLVVRWHPSSMSHPLLFMDRAGIPFHQDAALNPESSAWHDFCFVQRGCENKPSMSACCGVFVFYDPFSLYSLKSASIKFNPDKMLCTCLPLPAIQIENRLQSVHVCTGPPEWITWRRPKVSLISCHYASHLISFSRALQTFSNTKCKQ